MRLTQAKHMNSNQLVFVKTRLEEDENGIMNNENQHRIPGAVAGYNKLILSNVAFFAP